MMSRAIDSNSLEVLPATHHSIPWETKKPLIEKYGLWAVNRAEAVCPHNDVVCVEREAKRLFEVYTQRGGHDQIVTANFNRRPAGTDNGPASGNSPGHDRNPD